MTARAHRPIGRRAGVAGCAVIAASLHAGPLAAEAAHGEASAKTPHHSQPARTGQAAPDRTGSLARASLPRTPSQPPGAAIPAPAEADDALLVPTTLPAAPRSRMVACGETWQAMKMNGTTGDDSWREFAMKCLVAKDAPRP